MSKRIIALLRDTATEWYDDEAPRKAASLAYYTLLSTAPLTLFSVALVGLAFGERAARGQIADQIGSLVGPQAAAAIEGIARNANQSDAGPLSSIVGIAVLLFGASGVFGELQTAMNASGA